MLELRIKKLDGYAFLPTKASKDEAAFDFYALEDCWLRAPGVYTIRTGIACEIPAGYMGLFCDRSSMGKRGIKLMGGVIDSTYRGEILIMLAHLFSGDYYIKAGDKVAQMLVLPVPEIAVKEVTELTPTVRGDKGFGQLSGR